MGYYLDSFRIKRGHVAYGIDPDDKLIGSEGNLQDYVDVVLRRGRVVAVVFITIVSVVATYTWTCTPFYTAEARLVLEEKSPTTKDKDRMYGQPEYDQYKGYLATQIEMLKSPTLAEALVGRMNLTEHPEFTSQGWLTRFLTWFSINGNWESSEEDRKSRVANKMLKRLTAKPVKQSNLILVKIDATNRAFAGQLLQNYLHLHLQSNLEKKRQDSLQAAQWLKDELEKADKKLRHAQVALLDFIVDNRIVDSKDGALAEILTLVNKTMEGHVKSQEARAKVQAMDQQNVQEDSAILLPKEVNNEYLGRLKQELAMMESEYTQMRGLYAPNYPKLIMLGKKIKFLRENILTSEKNLVSSALNMAKTEEMLLKGSFDQATKEASRVRSLEAQYAFLKKDVDTGAEFQKILLKEYKEMDIRARTISNDIRMVDRPRVGAKPSWPKKWLFLLIGSIVGAVAGVSSAFFVDRLDDTLRSPMQIDTRFKVMRLGAVPHIAKMAAGTAGGKAIVTRPYEFMAYDHPKTLISDAIRNIQTSILLSNPDTPVQCMLVTSASASEGKTLIAASIATVLTGDKTKKVVIVDADLRKPRIQKVFGNANSKLGLSSFIKDTSLNVSDLIRAHRIPGLYYITAGPIFDNPVALLQSARMGVAIEELRKTFDYIVVDSPPVLGLPDVPTICTKADGVVLVARQGHVGRGELKESMDRLTSVPGCRLLGLVMNMVHAPGWSGYSSRYGSRYYYNYHNKYYS